MTEQRASWAVPPPSAARDAAALALAPLARADAATIELSGRRLRFEHARKPLFPTGETKADLLAYLLTVAPVLLPHLAERPVTLTRYPHGSDGPSFFQKRRPAGAPSWLDSVLLGGTRFLLVRTAADLALLAQWAAIEIHVPPLRVGADGEPTVDQLVIDLDPTPAVGWPETERAARGVHRLFEAAGVASYPKLSGQTGLHVYVPVRPRPGGAATAEIARALAQVLVRAAPEVYTVVRQVSRRRGVYVDHGQNAAGRTMACVYGVRPGSGARVSAPLHWDEIGALSPEDVTIHNMPDRLTRLGDLFAPVLGPPEPIEALESLTRDVLGPARSGRTPRSGPKAGARLRTGR